MFLIATELDIFSTLKHDVRNSFKYGYKIWKQKKTQ